MQIVQAWPPNIEEIRKAFTLTKRVAFAYGDIIYNPHAMRIDKYVHAHEEVHQKQQERFGGVDAWWARYLSDTAFRAEQELEAYRAQYLLMKKDFKMKPSVVMRYGKALAEAASGETYGNAVTFGYAHAFITA